MHDREAGPAEEGIQHECQEGRSLEQQPQQHGGYDCKDDQRQHQQYHARHTVSLGAVLIEALEQPLHADSEFRHNVLDIEKSLRGAEYYIQSKAGAERGKGIHQHFQLSFRQTVSRPVLSALTDAAYTLYHTFCFFASIKPKVSVFCRLLRPDK